MYYKAIPITERLPELNQWVTTIDAVGEHRVYRLTQYGWNMRDADGVNSPLNNLAIVFWLEQTDLNQLENSKKKFPNITQKVPLMY